MFVYIHRTELQEYSQDITAETLPESLSLKQLRSEFLAHAGFDLFTKNIKPGNRVVIKPNLVRDWHPDGLDIYALITHPMIIRAIVDEVYEALQGSGEIIIADAPMGDTNFKQLLELTGLNKIVQYYKEKYNFKIEIRDLRKYQYTLQTGPHGYAHEVRNDLPGDPEGYVEIDLGDQSAFANMPRPDLLQGTDVARRVEAITKHTASTNKYLISKTILNADVLISVPKLKTHSKVGTTINSKGMVGINGDKNYLPHFRWGSATEGGDQHPGGTLQPVDAARMKLGRAVADHILSRNTKWAKGIVWALQQVSGSLAKLLRFKSLSPVLINGGWPGNDTCWRLPADLIRVAIFADAEGNLQKDPQRKFISIVDGIVAGEKNGPLNASPKACGVLIAGEHAVAVDLVSSRLMGFNPKKIKYISELLEGVVADLQPGFSKIDMADIVIASNNPYWVNLLQSSDAGLNFLAPSRWEGEIEINPPVAGIANPVAELANIEA